MRAVNPVWQNRRIKSLGSVIMPKIVVLSDRTEYSDTISNLSVSHVTLIVVDSVLLGDNMKRYNWLSIQYQWKQLLLSTYYQQLISWQFWRFNIKFCYYCTYIVCLHYPYISSLLTPWRGSKLVKITYRERVKPIFQQLYNVPAIPICYDIT